MKKLYAIMAIILVTVATRSQSPQRMSYQAVIRNTGNELVTTQVGIQISILQGHSDGTPVYIETHTPIPNDNGLVTIEIGGGIPVTGTFDAIDWSAGPYFIKTETAVAEPLTAYTITGTSQLLSVPYALYAKTAGNTDVLLNKVLQIQADLGVQDADGNTYKAVKIGTQVWMAENLKTTKYTDGTPIPLVTGAAAWGALTTPGYCWYDNDIANKNTYGALYNWYAVETLKLCPSGWHVALDEEFTALTNYLGSASVAGGKLKEMGLTHWADPNTDADNSSGFTALPGGARGLDGSFGSIGFRGNWWSYTLVDFNSAWSRNILFDYTYIDRFGAEKAYGFSVRCVKHN